jgi:LysR family transcriptional regulator, glycine cleavage system transcriptional activator
MDKARRRLLPPMSALHSFVAAAARQSFSKAAGDIGLTQSAVSRQVALLEDWLQQPLFRREGRSVVLTKDGRAYAEAIEAGLDRIRSATAQMIDKRADWELSIATLPSFGMRWLAPRLPGLTKLHPHLLINFAARSHEFDLASEGFDAAIHFGESSWPNMCHDLLFPEIVTPVLSPALLQNGEKPRPEIFLSIPRLSLRNRPAAWSQWFQHQGLVPPDAQPIATFEHFLMLAQAAVAGAGVALMPTFLIEPELRDGTLIQPLDAPMPIDGAYYLVYPEERLKSPSFQHFRNWIIGEANDVIINKSD